MIGCFRGAQLRLALGIEALEHLRRGEIGQHLADRRVERELALFDQLHGGGGRNRLGHRGDPEHAVCGHAGGFGQVAFSEGPLIDASPDPSRR